MRYYVTIEACEANLRERISPGDQILVLKPWQPVYTQLAFLPDGADVIACPPTTWSKQEKEEFAYKVSESVLSLMVTKNTVAHFHDTWVKNLIFNYDQLYRARLADEIQGQGPATIYGNGPSLNPDIQEGVIFSPWHCTKRITKAHYIGHIDAALPMDATGRHAPTRFKPERGIIAVPTVAPEFLETHKNDTFYVYFSQGCSIDMHLASKLNTPGHGPISCTVVDMLMQVAIMAGHKEIHLTGIDLCFNSPEEGKAYDPIKELYEDKAVDGRTVWTHIGWHKQKLAAEGLIRRNPHIKFINHSNGLLIEGTENV